ncbi:MAG TPA: branched-chain amino acid ABC transporter permease [Candidatus Dormibacteraeota bacterium]|nr:branched-chain amino acid ABC transporter permease [Candidatus Dormibacteraeota bacterium]
MNGALARTPAATLRAIRSSQVSSLIGLLILAAALALTIQHIFQNNASYFFQILVIGIADGSIYALIALGYTMVYGIIELINFAHGDVFTLGAFISIWLLPMFGVSEGASAVSWILPFLAVALLTLAICGLINIGIERVAYRPLRHAPRLAPLITAIGMSSILEGAMYLWRGPFNLHYPNLLPSTQLVFGGVAIGYKDLIVVGLAIVLVVLLTVFINTSKLGRAMRATAQDRDAAQLMGININGTIASTFFIGAVLAAAGGIIWGLYINNVTFDLGFSTGLIAFTSAVFGGIGNIPGAALGGLLIGIIAAFNNAYFDSAWTEIIIFAILIATLVFRPTGLLGMRVPEK